MSQNASTFHVKKKGCSTKLNMTFNFPQHVKQIMLVKGKKKTSNRAAFDDNAVCQSVLYIQGFYLSDWLIVPQTYKFS